MIKSLHISHTDISSDSRILKEMQSLQNNGYFVCGVGIEKNNGSHKTYNDFDVQSIRLTAKKLKFFPQKIRHSLSLLELFFKVIPPAIRVMPNVVHCHDTLALLIGVLVKMFTGSKLIYDAHELESDRNGLSFFMQKATFIVEKILWKYVDAFVTVSPSIQEWYMKSIGPKLSSVILNSPSYDNLRCADKAYLHKRFSIPFDRKIFIYVGLLERGRGLDILAQAFVNSENSSHIVFMGYGKFMETVKILEEKHKNIHFHDAVPHSQVVSIVSSASFGLCMIENISLSDYYSLPNKLFEYCFAGVPVLASSFPDIRKVIHDYNIGECVDLNEDKIKNKIADIEKNTITYKFNNIESLSWLAQERKLISLYKEFES